MLAVYLFDSDIPVGLGGEGVASDKRRPTGQPQSESQFARETSSDRH